MEKEKTVKELQERINQLENRLEDRQSNLEFYRNEYNKMREKNEAIVSILRNLTILSNL